MTVVYPGGIVPILVAQQAVLGCMMQARPKGECRTKITKGADGVRILRADADSDWMYRVRAGNFWGKIRDDFRRHLARHDFERIDLYEEGKFVHSWTARNPGGGGRC